MRIKYELLIYLFFVPFFTFSQDPGILWSKNFGGVNNEFGRNILSPDSGQSFIIICDTFQVINNNLTDSTDIWIMKLDSAGEKIWSKKFGGSGNDRIRRAFLHPDGGLTIIAYSNSNDGDVSGNHGGGDIWVAEISSAGNLIWQKTLGGSLLEDYRSAELLGDNSLIIAGYTTSTNGDVTGYHSGNDIWIVKLSNTGSLEWQRCLGGSGDDRPRGIIALPGESYIVTGFSNSTNGDVIGNHGNYDLWMIRLNSTGGVIWSKVFGGTWSDAGHKAIVSGNGNIVVLAETNSANGDVLGYHGSGGGGLDVWMLSIDSTNGDIIWQRCVGGTMGELPRNMVKDLDGNFVVVSQTNSNDGDIAVNHGSLDVWIFKISDSGNLIWEKTLGGSSIDDLFNYISPFNGLVNTYRSNIFVDPADNSYLLLSVTLSNDGDVSGYHFSRPEPNRLRDAWVIKINNNGDLVWQKCLGGSTSDELVDFQKTGDEEFVFLGYSSSSNGDLESNNGGVDLWVLKLGPVSRIYTSQFVDYNSNGIKEGNEPYSDLNIQSAKAGDIRIKVPVNGESLFEVDTGMHITKPILQNSYYSVVPLSDTSVFTHYFQTDSATFRLIPVPDQRDININIVPESVARPGFSLTYDLICRNIGTDTVASGQVLFKNDSRITFVSSMPVADAVNGDTIKWNYTNFKPFDTIKFRVNMEVQSPPGVNINDTLVSTAFITPLSGDLTPTDDSTIFRQRVQGAYDPNDKSENFEGVITKQKVLNGAYLNYLIRFQNTGTDTAFNVTVRDTLDVKLDWVSLDMIETSHPYQLSIKDGNKLTWNFLNIRLVDSFHNEPGSHGYISYRIKPMPGVLHKDTIKNSASIYFDFNPPVRTNIQETVIKDENVVCPGGALMFPAGLAGTSYQWQVNAGGDYVDITDGVFYTGSNAEVLQLTNLPTSFYGYKYRCAVTTPAGIVYSRESVLKFTVIWKGTSGTSWEDPTNWDCGILPDANTDVIIKKDAFYQPDINTNTSCRSITLSSSASINVKPGVTITITGK